MKKLLLTILSVSLLLLCGCKYNTPTIVGSWNGETSLFKAETDTESIVIIFYDEMEGEEIHTKNGISYKSYEFDYTVNDGILTVYVGEEQREYSIRYSESNSTETMELTADDGTSYTYTLASRRTPGIL